MTTTACAPGSTATRTTQPALWRATVVAGVVAAAAAASVAAVAQAAGVSLEIDGEAIPLLGFANLTLMCVALGYVLAVALRRWASNPQRAFVVATLALTAASFVPDLTVPGAAFSTRLALMATHIVAAAIVIPVIARRLDSDHR